MASITLNSATQQAIRGAIMICGATTLLVANCLRDLERRIGRLERGRAD